MPPSCNYRKDFYTLHATAPNIFENKDYYAEFASTLLKSHL